MYHPVDAPRKALDIQRTKFTLRAAMPIYEYACQKCGNVVEVFQKISDKGPGKCPKCGGKLARVLSQTSFQLKGGGWYKDLYSSVKPGSDSDSSAADAPKGETKPEAKPEAKTEPKPGAKSDAEAPAAPAKPAPTAPKPPAKTKKKTAR
jgi:putative FmdB family regulatory protein